MPLNSIKEQDVIARKLQRLKLYAGETPILVRDFGPIKYWTIKEYPLNIKSLQDKPLSEIENLFRQGLIPLKSYDETLKTKHSTYYNRRWFLSKQLPKHELDLFNPVSLNSIISLILLLFTFALIFLRGFDSLTGSFILSEFFNRVNPYLMILLYLSIAYFITSTIFLKKHTQKTKEGNALIKK
ncbi:MAG: hypothetical protein PWP03_139 [Candidatus Woesearchaeota archaeon]|nr:hypothetical protein [Candidatus Woesearchaeota archaeon]MDN5327501.1 hypothetical protein [Candidatus Woesearchaeota archaeon]